MGQMKTLREWRKLRGISMRALARQVGISHVTMMRYEMGRIRNPSWRVVWRICRILDADPKQVKEFAEALERR